MPLLRHYDHTGTSRFVTFSCYRHLSLLSNSADRDHIVTQLRASCSKYRVKTFGYVIMPDHIHLVLRPPEEVILTDMLREFKSLSAREFLRNFDSRGETWTHERRSLWQARGYDHNCRTLAITLEKINYCHMNPVRRGFVTQAEAWQWSSASWYAGNRDVLLQMDSLDEMCDSDDVRQL